MKKVLLLLTVTVSVASCKKDIDGANTVTYNWTGSIAAGATTNVTLPVFTSSSGTHAFAVSTSNPNSTTDANTANNASTISYLIRTNGLTLPFTEGFESTTFPPTGWTLNNPDAKTTWTKSTAAKKSGAGSAVLLNYNYQNTYWQQAFLHRHF